jgi:hypothetical protein
LDGDENVCLFLRRLGNAIILRALNDLSSSKYGGYRFNTARNFCLGKGIWKDSLLIWCECAEIEPIKVQKEAERRINARKPV